VALFKPEKLHFRYATTLRNKENGVQKRALNKRLDGAGCSLVKGDKLVLVELVKPPAHPPGWVFLLLFQPPRSSLE
jgi:hypothetical protein